MTELVLPKMAAKCRGYVINLGSSAARYPTPLLSLYSATKVTFTNGSLQMTAIFLIYKRDSM